MIIKTVDKAIKALQETVGIKPKDMTIRLNIKTYATLTGREDKPIILVNGYKGCKVDIDNTIQDDLFFITY